MGLVVLSSVIWNPGDDNNSVVVVDKGFIVGRRNRRASADGGSGCDRGASAGIDQGLDFGGVLEFKKIIEVPYCGTSIDLALIVERNELNLNYGLYISLTLYFFEYDN